MSNVKVKLDFGNDKSWHRGNAIRGAYQSRVLELKDAPHAGEAIILSDPEDAGKFLKFQIMSVYITPGDKEADYIAGLSLISAMQKDNLFTGEDEYGSKPIPGSCLIHVMGDEDHWSYDPDNASELDGTKMKFSRVPAVGEQIRFKSRFYRVQDVYWHPKQDCEVALEVVPSGAD
jgi:hypothetical protein